MGVAIEDKQLAQIEIHERTTHLFGVRSCLMTCSVRLVIVKGRKFNCAVRKPVNNRVDSMM